MTQHGPMDEHLEVVATLAGRAIEASLEELRQRAELFEYMRQMLAMGASMSDLSAASGLTPDEIRKHLNYPQNRPEFTSLTTS